MAGGHTTSAEIGRKGTRSDQMWQRCGISRVGGVGGARGPGRTVKWYCACVYDVMKNVTSSFPGPFIMTEGGGVPRYSVCTRGTSISPDRWNMSYIAPCESLCVADPLIPES